LIEIFSRTAWQWPWHESGSTVFIRHFSATDRIFFK